MTTGIKTRFLLHPARMMTAAVLALLAARVLRLPEVYWAPISALIVIQSDFGASLSVSWNRLAGTAVGAGMGALLAVSFGPTVIALGLGVFAIGLMSAALRLERPAERFAGIAFAIVLLASPADPAWIIALHRFVGVAAGILTGLLISAFWPELQPAPAGSQEQTPGNRNQLP